MSNYLDILTKDLRNIIYSYSYSYNYNYNYSELSDMVDIDLNLIFNIKYYKYSKIFNQIKLYYNNYIFPDIRLILSEISINEEYMKNNHRDKILDKFEKNVFKKFLIELISQ